ncbi:hypothetical protein LX32DRAFT_693437 [Colletotrichum zoysiae]|uniref:Uncharacterized protein n=1 Tax=Colletotrichum zoysiae TaxID=1216348 RepID=A0AAD9HJJ3_9PEZI|nr:hypothetical protein LX32DRAFT_693437 [Colletotrichum zoysiae]
MSSARPPTSAPTVAPPLCEEPFSRGHRPSRTRASVAGLLDYDSLVMFEYPAVEKMTDSREVEQLRRGGLSTSDHRKTDHAGNDEVKLAPGEVYCRWGGRSGSIQCTQDSRFSSESNLRNHVKKHKMDGRPVAVKSRRAGANSIDVNDNAAGFYDRLTSYTTGGLSEGDIQTPSKKKHHRSALHSSQFPPAVKARLRSYPNLAEMRRRVSLPATVAARVDGPGKVLWTVHYASILELDNAHWMNPPVPRAAPYWRLKSYFQFSSDFFG